MTYTVTTLSPQTWAAFAAMVEEHNGVWGGCWCLEFHPEGSDHSGVAVRREHKLRRLSAGGAHAALVMDGDAAVGWCQYGPPDELPRVKSRRAYERGLEQLPDWRITCFFVHKRHRGRGVAGLALDGALEQIAVLGGGLVESYPEDTAGREVQARFLPNLSLAAFEARGFTRQRRVAPHRWVVTKAIPAPSPAT